MIIVITLIQKYPPNQIYILNKEFDEYCLETIENKIQTLTQELELLKERSNLLHIWTLHRYIKLDIS